MSSTFSLGGDPTAIRTSAQQWNAFGESAGTASTDIKGLSSDEFVGDEADTYRDKVNDNLPPNLDRTAEAWKQIGAALKVYADKLEGFQQELARLQTHHDHQQESVRNAQSSVAAAHDADAREQTRVQTATAALKSGETLPTSNYHSSTAGAQSGLTEAQQNLQHTTDAANRVHSEHDDAVRACCREIDDAKSKRFQKPPGFWDRLKNSVVDWVADHAGVLKMISGALKLVSAVAGVLSFIPILAPITGPIALIAGAAALGIDVAVKLATGEGSWLSIGVDAALMVLPGVGKLLKPAIMGTKAGKVVNAVAARGLSAAKDTRAAKTLNGMKNAATSAVSKIANKPLKMAVNGFPKNQAIAKYVTRTRPRNGYYDVAMHGTPRSVEIVTRNGRKVVADHRTLAKYIGNQKDYTPGTPVRLLSCKTGASPNGVAQNLANKMNVEVIAPNNTLWIYENGALTVGSTARDRSGAFQQFLPGGGR